MGGGAGEKGKERAREEKKTWQNVKGQIKKGMQVVHYSSNVSVDLTFFKIKNLGGKINNHCTTLDQRSTNFSAKNILGFTGHRNSILTIHLCHVV